VELVRKVSPHLSVTLGIHCKQSLFCEWGLRAADCAHLFGHSQLAACLFICLLGLLFHPESGGSTFLQNVCKLTIRQCIVSQKIELFIVTSVVTSNLVVAMLFRALRVWVSARICGVFFFDLSENTIFFANRNNYTEVISDELRTPKVLGRWHRMYACVFICAIHTHSVSVRTKKAGVGVTL
jgi:hypothetical protein